MFGPGAAGSPLILADLILDIHFLFVLFVMGGLALIWTGAALGWGWVHNFWFRLSHLAAILFVAGESLVGIACPLTVWENALRRSGGGERGFLQRWVHRVLYYDFPEWAFTLLYVAFALAVIATYVMVRPKSHKRAGEVAA